MGREERHFLSPDRKQLPAICSDGGVGRKLSEDSQKRASLNYLLVHRAIHLHPVYLHEGWRFGWGYMGQWKQGSSDPDCQDTGNKKPLWAKAD